jgi:uncharacterized protein
MRFTLITAMMCVAFALSPARGAAPDPISTDPQADHAYPARMIVVHIPSHGAIMNGAIWQAAGRGPHPVVVLYHGFPGNEQNLDLAYTLRRAGWSVLTFHYRGSWGSGGTFSFTHVFEDARAALDFIRDPALDKQYGLDPSTVVLIGHSMGGAAAAKVGADTAGLGGVVLISAANFGGFAKSPGGHAAVVRMMADNMESLAGTSPQTLAREAEAHADWDIMGNAAGLARQRLLVLTADDGLSATGQALADAVNRAKGDTTVVHMATDHGYSDHRIALQRAVLEWLAHR